jgi:hypothetical protein
LIKVVALIKALMKGLDLIKVVALAQNTLKTIGRPERVVNEQDLADRPR